MQASKNNHLAILAIALALLVAGGAHSAALAPSPGFQQIFDFSVTPTTFASGAYWNGCGLAAPGVNGGSPNGLQLTNYTDSSSVTDLSGCIKGQISSGQSGSKNYYATTAIALRPSGSGKLRVWACVPSAASGTTWSAECSYAIGTNCPIAGLNPQRTGTPPYYYLVSGWQPFFTYNSSNGAAYTNNPNRWFETEVGTDTLPVTLDTSGQLNLVIRVYSGGTGTAIICYFDCLSASSGLMPATPNNPTATDNGNGTFTLSAVAAAWPGASVNEIHWYDDPNCTHDIGTGNVVVSPSVTTTYYCKAKVVASAVGTAYTWYSTSPASVTATVASDSTPPTNCSININNSALYTKTTGVTLALSATDNTAVTQMKFSTDGTTYSAPEAYSTSKSYTLPSGDGVKTVYVKFGDAANNWSAAVSDSITLDQTAPTISNLSVTPANVGSTGNCLKGDLYVDANAADSGSGLASVQAKMDSGSYEAVTPKTGPTYEKQYVIDADWTNGSHTVYVKATDIAGNETVQSTAFAVNKNEVSGVIGLQGLTSAPLDRSVVFVLNGSTTKTLTLSFINGMSSYSITDVPDLTSISAKTAWSLRRNISVSATDGQYIADFAGSNVVLGGDLTGDNLVNALDYSALRAAWGTAPSVPGYAAGDINGDGATDNADYLIQKANWYKKGDAQ